MVSISGDLPISKLKRKHLTSRKWSSAGSQFLSFFVVPLTWNFGPQRFSQKLGTILAFVTPSPARLVLWQYNMHVFFVTYFGNIGPPFCCRLIELLFPFVCSTCPLETEYAPRAILPILLVKRSLVPYEALSCSIERCFASKHLNKNLIRWFFYTKFPHQDRNPLPTSSKSSCQLWMPPWDMSGFWMKFLIS